MKTIFSLLGAYLGAVAAGFEGALSGFFLGLVVGALINANTRLRLLEDRLQRLEQMPAPEHEQDAAPVSAQPAAESAAPANQVVTEPPAAHANATATVAADVQTDAAAVENAENVEPVESSKAAGPQWPPPPAGPQMPAFLRKLWQFFSSGNVVVKVGAVILFFGLSFLVKYAAERGLVPMEFRLIGIAATGMVLLFIGWRLRQRMPGYALVLQGAAVAILYLTVFASAQLYDLMPLGLAFVLLLLLVMLSALLAVLQDSRSLAMFASAGGFLVPILTSTGQGSHVQLFTYYLLLNIGIVAIAWFKAWRGLNLLGFIFTFVIGSIWGWQYYQPQHFTTTQPFLILFFLLYLAVPILFALRQPPRLKGLVDGTLVFGVPLVAFALQSALVNAIEYATAWSALAVSAVYIVLATVLWRSGHTALRLLIESFLALGVLFATLAVPLALDGNWTAAVWSLEGAALVWIGLRQSRLYTRLFGLLLVVGSALAFLLRTADVPATLAVFNSTYIGCVLISLGGLWVAYLYQRYRDQLHAAERVIIHAPLVWGMLWWLSAGLLEIDRFVAYAYELNAALIFLTATALLAVFLCRRLQWTALSSLAVLLLPAMLLIWLIQQIDYAVPAWANLGWLAWPLALAGQLIILRYMETTWPDSLLRRWHQFGALFMIYLLTWLVAEWVIILLGYHSAWSLACWALVPFLLTLSMPKLMQLLRWPLQRFADSYTGQGQWPLLLWLGLWVLYACVQTGDPLPLAYIPVLNPLELMQLLCLLLIGNTLYQQPALNIDQLPLRGLGLSVFLVLNAILARSVHFFADVRFQPEHMLASHVFNAGASILWTTLAMIIMYWAVQHARRSLWFVGAGLLAVVVLKLFTLDLADVGGMARIVSFISVGVLILVIGYLAPMPPRQQQVETS
ncbi:MAG: DUF2339 domain-containing protein [Gammaproteobacteria bacterium]